MHSLLLAGGFIENLLRDLGVNPKVLLVQVVIFGFTFVVLSRLLFGRVLGFLTSREQETANSTEEIRRGRTDLEHLTKEYEGHIAKIEKEAYDRLQAILKEALEARGKIVAEAQKRSADEVKAAMADITREKTAARTALKTEILALSRQASERALGVPVDAGVLDQAIRASAAQRIG